jgi:hypothetical protein
VSAWTDRILSEFPTELARFWIACDPDDVLLDEGVLHSLRERGFEVLPFDDSVVFRAEYEERYRDAWDRGEARSERALVLQLRGSDLNALPWDYIRQARTVSLGLADLFPKLSYGVVRQLPSEHHEAMFRAQDRHAPQPLGEAATKDFILTHVFRISPYMLERPEDFWRELLRLHHRGASLPGVLADHVAMLLKDTPVGGLPVADLLSSRSFTLRVLQDAWRRFLLQLGIDAGSGADPEAAESIAIVVPFEHPDVRAVVDTLFLDGGLRPVGVVRPQAGVPEWVKVGLVEDPHTQTDLVGQGVRRLAANLPMPGSSHRDWTDFARRLGELIFRFHSLSADAARPLAQQVGQLQRDADERLRLWLTTHFADLPSLPAARGPVMVHHVPRYLALRRAAGEARVALVVFDGLAMDQWLQVRDHLAARVRGFEADEGACFAWLPTLTSISRQALFSGLRPREFSASIDTTTQEPQLWARFWLENGLRRSEVCYAKGLKRTEQLADLAAEVSKPGMKVAGIVVDMVDELVHGAMLGKRGISGQIAAWCETGFVEGLVRLLAGHGYHIYLAADHGNVDAEGIGRLSQGVMSEVKGERVRTYRSDELAGSVPSELDTFRLGVPGLPPEVLPVYAGNGKAFVTRGERTVAHGGPSVEELIVPFVRMHVAGAGR